MKVLLSIFSGNEKILHIKKSLESLGCEVELMYSDAYRQVCPYYRKKLDELGLHSGRRKYLQSVHDRFYQLLENFQPDIVLFINTPKDILTVEDIRYANRFSKTVCWFVDGIAGRSEIEDYLRVFSKIYVFEHGDVAYLQQMGLLGTYLPVGYNDAFSNVSPLEKKYDILFIGSPFHNRLQILEKLSMAAVEKRWNLKIIGPFYDEKYPWKKLIFKRKYPYIYRFLENRRVLSEEAAKLYAETKICLNIHDTRHKSPNPRTFEIMATGSFELIDRRGYWGGLLPEKDVVEYMGEDDLIDKIGIYIANDSKRKEVAYRGNRNIVGKFDMKSLLVKVITDVMKIGEG